MTKTLTVSIYEPLDVSGARNGLIYRPETHEVYTWATVGNGVPMVVFNRQEIWLANLPVNYDRDKLAAWCERNADEFDEFAQCYQGTKWNGNNHIGKWSERLSEAHDRFGWALHDAIGMGAITEEA